MIWIMTTGSSILPGDEEGKERDGQTARKEMHR